MRTTNRTQETRTISESLKERILEAPVIFTVSIFVPGVITSLFINDGIPTTERRVLESLAQSSGPITQEQYRQILLLSPVLESIGFAITLFTVMMTIHKAKKIHSILQNIKEHILEGLDKVLNNLGTVFIYAIFSHYVMIKYVEMWLPLPQVAVYTGLTLIGIRAVEIAFKRIGKKLSEEK